MAQICLYIYGTRNPKVTPVNTIEYAAKTAVGLRRIADMLTDPTTEFLVAQDFPSGQLNNTHLSISMVTEPETIIPEPEDFTDLNGLPDLQPRSQFNVHVMIKHVTDEDELADGLTAVGRLKRG